MFLRGAKAAEDSSEDGWEGSHYVKQKEADGAFVPQVTLSAAEGAGAWFRWGARTAARGCLSPPNRRRQAVLTAAIFREVTPGSLSRLFSVSSRIRIPAQV